MRFPARAGRSSPVREAELPACPCPRHAVHQVAAALQWMARAPLPSALQGRDFFRQAEQDFWAPGEEVQITRLLTERKKSAELGLKRIPHLGLLKMGTKLVSKCSVSLLKWHQLTEHEKSRQTFGYISLLLGHFFGSCVVKMSGFPNVISCSNRREIFKYGFKNHTSHT